jgi:hypothetical protein
MDPINTLIQLTDQIQNLDMVQSWIDNARSAAPATQVVQLELDRCQTEIDSKRALIQLMMLDIASRN